MGRVGEGWTRGGEGGERKEERKRLNEIMKNGFKTAYLFGRPGGGKNIVKGK